MMMSIAASANLRPHLGAQQAAGQRQVASRHQVEIDDGLSGRQCALDGIERGDKEQEEGQEVGGRIGPGPSPASCPRRYSTREHGDGVGARAHRSHVYGGAGRGGPGASTAGGSELGMSGYGAHRDRRADFIVQDNRNQKEKENKKKENEECSHERLSAVQHRDACE